MKKIIIFSFLIVSITTITFSQDMEITWQQCFGGSNEEIVNDIKDVPGGYLLVGSTESNDGDISFNHGSSDAWIIKIDSSGNLLWEKTYGGSDGDGWRIIIPTLDNRYYLVGASGSSDGDLSYDPYPGSNDVWVAKVDSVGEIIWEKIIGGEIIDLMYTATLTNDGGIAMFGFTGSQTGDVSINYGMYDMWLVKLNSDGDIEWDKSFGTDDFDWGIDVIQTSDGGFLVGGSSSIGNGGNLTCEPYNFYAEVILLKLDSLGNIEWQNCYGGSDSDSFNALIEIEDGYILSASGWSGDGDLTGSGWHGKADIWVIKTDFFGNIIWQKCYGGSQTESASNIFIGENNELVFIGATRSQNGDVTNNHSISEYDDDIWFLKIDSVGQIITQKCFGGIGNEFIYGSAVQKGDNNYVIAAYTNYGPSYDVGCDPNGEFPDDDWWVFEIKDCTQYAPTIPTTPAGEDTVCNQGSEPYLYTITPAALAWDYEWQLQPATAGTLTADTLETLVEWADDFTGTATLVVRSTNDCGFSEWSAPKYVQVNNCLGTGENMESKIRVFPNPAKEYVEFQVSGFMFQVGSKIRVISVMGEEVAKLPIKTEKTVWDVRHIKPGLYFYSIEREENYFTGKIVIQK